MSQFLVSKELDGEPVVFLRFDGPERLIVEVSGTERSMTRKQGRALPEHVPSNGDDAPLSESLP